MRLNGAKEKQIAALIMLRMHCCIHNFIQRDISSALFHREFINAQQELLSRLL